MFVNHKIHYIHENLKLLTGSVLDRKRIDFV